MRAEHVMIAFRKAHHAGENAEFSLAARNVFRAIAHELWLAAGRPDDDAAAPAAEVAQ
jgi:hypothetical protein